MQLSKVMNIKDKVGNIVKIKFFLIFALSCLLSSILLAASDNILQYVDPFIGTGGTGHTFPGATYPFGMIQVSPDTGTEGWNHCSGYDYNDTTIEGFSVTHLSGTGAAAGGDVMLAPILGGTRITPFFLGGYKMPFNHNNEIATPGCYSVILDNGIKVELTTTKWVAFERYIFPLNASTAGFILNLSHKIGGNFENAWAKIISDSEIEGYINGGRFCGATRTHVVYFYIKFSLPIKSSKVWEGLKIIDDKDIVNLSKSYLIFPEGGLYVDFNTENTNEIDVKVAISYTSMEEAIKNMSTTSSLSFENVIKSNEKAWKNYLGKIDISSSNVTDLKKFYTALYHTAIDPSLFSNADGSYIGPDNKVYISSYPHYTTFSLWDTFRAENPLLTIIDPKMEINEVRSLLDIYKEDGWLPKWYEANTDTNCMIGSPADNIIAEAIIDHLNGFDIDTAYEAIKKDAFVQGTNHGRKSLDLYIKFGYIPDNLVNQATSKTLEYAFNDFCVAEAARILGKNEDYKALIKRAGNWKNVFDQNLGFVTGRNSDGKWMEQNFNPVYGNYSFLTEGNAWQWTFSVTPDIYGLIKVFGGISNFDKKLDELFSNKSEISGPPDITGCIGQAALGNEPSQRLPYLYIYGDQPWKTQEIVRYALNHVYGTGPAGLPGNDDCGEISSWFVFSAMGFYPEPPLPYYFIGSPLFQQVQIHLPNGNIFTVLAKDNNENNIYVQSAYLNGKKINRAWITYDEIEKGGTLELIMGSNPNEKFGAEPFPDPFSSN